ncbi:hypothetical protein VB774_09535 [Pseudanabaena galeata UHCC 0370]|uniref:Uncharacterized protein n=2 Tax=Pseudanabaena galeata TaxID=1112103 RepID=A0ABU5THT1_9CYAN|nr:hypothetical protein [Pseudanabaena galeata UHCC 0370]
MNVVNVSDPVVDRSASNVLSHSRHENYQEPRQGRSHQALIYESKYLIAEAEKLMSNLKVTCSPQELIDESKALITHAEKLVSNCKAMRR